MGTTRKQRLSRTLITALAVGLLTASAFAETTARLNGGPLRNNTTVAIAGRAGEPTRINFELFNDGDSQDFVTVVLADDRQRSYRFETPLDLVPIAAGERLQVPILFEPPTGGAFTAQVQFVLLNEDAVIAINLDGSAPSLEEFQVSQDGKPIVSDSEFAFDRTAIGQTREVTFTVDNVSNGSLFFDTGPDSVSPAVNLIAEPNSPFSVVQQPSVFLDVDESAEFRVAFTPTIDGDADAQLAMLINDRFFSIQLVARSIIDCDGNGAHDPNELEADATGDLDCDENGVLDKCELDSDGDGIIDACEEPPADPNEGAADPNQGAADPNAAAAPNAGGDDADDDTADAADDANANAGAGQGQAADAAAKQRDDAAAADRARQEQADAARRASDAAADAAAAQAAAQAAQAIADEALRQAEEEIAAIEEEFLPAPPLCGFGAFFAGLMSLASLTGTKLSRRRPLR